MSDASKPASPDGQTAAREPVVAGDGQNFGDLRSDVLKEDFGTYRKYIHSIFYNIL